MEYTLKVYEGILPEGALLQEAIALLPRVLRRYLSEKSSSLSRTTIVIAFDVEKIVGLALATAGAVVRIAHIHHLYVEPAARRHGIGTALLTAVKAALLRQESQCATIDFDLAEQAAEPFLRSQGAEGFFLRLIRCHFDGRNFSPPWLKYPFELPAGLSLFPWNELTAEERSQVDYIVKGGGVPAVLSPFRRIDQIAHFNSLGIRSEKEGVVAWIITHYLSDARDSISYSSFFVDKAYRTSTISSCLLAESINRQKNSAVHNSYCEVNVEEVDSRWTRFIRKRLVPYSVQVDQLWRAHFPLH